MHDFNRRDFLRGSTIAAAGSTFGLMVPADAAPEATLPSSSGWDAGRVRHLLPTVSESRVLVKVSFRSPLTEAPMLRIGNTTVRGRLSDTRGEFWQFHAADLKPGRPYTLALVGNRGRALCEPWSLATFPAPDEKPGSFRVLFYTCAGGHEAFGFLPPAVRNRLPPSHRNRARSATRSRPTDSLDFRAQLHTRFQDRCAALACRRAL
jgi:hypothetical protein